MIGVDLTPLMAAPWARKSRELEIVPVNLGAASFAYQVRWRVGASVKVMCLELGTLEEYALAEAERVSSWFRTEAQVCTAYGRVLATYSDGMRVDE
jgi:hypothetical protein